MMSVTRAEARVRELEAQLAMAKAAVEEAGRLVAQFRSQRDELRGALEFYADERNWTAKSVYGASCGSINWVGDGGQHARAALRSPAGPSTDEDKP